MANTSAILLALMVVTTASMAHGSAVIGIHVNQANIIGVVKCLVPGKPVPVGVAANVSVLCNKGQTTLLQGMSDPLGLMAVSVNLSNSTVIISDILDCTVKAMIPARTCVVNPPNGTVLANLKFNGIVGIISVVINLGFSINI